MGQATKNGPTQAQYDALQAKIDAMTAAELQRDEDEANGFSITDKNGYMTVKLGDFSTGYRGISTTALGFQRLHELRDRIEDYILEHGVRLTSDLAAYRASKGKK